MRPIRFRLASLAVAGCLAWTSAGRAQDSAGKDTSIEDARSHVNKAKVHYDLGEYEQAAEEYILVYRIKALPALLFNIAQAYRQAGKYEKAKQFYRSFLRESPDQKNRPVIEKAIHEIDELLAREKHTREAAPSGTADATPLPSESLPLPKSAVPADAGKGSPKPSAVVIAQPAGRAQPAAQSAAVGAKPQGPVVAVATQPSRAPADSVRATVPAASTADEGTPLYKKWWLWTAVGVVAVGAGAAAMSAGGNSAPSSHFGTSKVFP